MRLENKVAIVTGAASGFGAEIARVFAREGAKVAVLDINSEGAAAVAREIGPAAIRHYRRCHQARRHRKRCAQNLGCFRAHRHRGEQRGLEPQEPAHARSGRRGVRPRLRRECEVDLSHGACVVPVLAEQGGGVIINIGSTAGIRPRPGLTWYNGSKGAVNLMSRSMAVELAPQKIRVNCVAPVMGATGLLEQFMGLPDTPENRAKFIATVPLGRLSEPRDIANACLYLASDEAEFVTGVVLEVDGGRTI